MKHRSPLLGSPVLHGYDYSVEGGIGFFRAPLLSAQHGLEHGFTARFGGVSEGSYASLNLNFTKPEDPLRVRENFRRFSMASRIPFEEMTIVSYEHGSTVLRVGAADAGRGFDREKLPPCDGLITNETGVTLITSHADCGAFFIFDPVRRAIGLAHAGWKGTLGRIGGNVVALMEREFGSDPADLLASSGPCICGDCYEVDESLGMEFVREFRSEQCARAYRPGKMLLDIEAAAVIQLLDAGLKKEHINMMEKCTYESPELLFSHRLSRGSTGDMAGFMRLV